MSEEFFSRKEYTVWDGQHRYTIIRETVDMFRDSPKARELWSDDRDVWAETEKFAKEIFEVFGPYLSIRDLGCWMHALADQYEHHWQWRNDYSKKIRDDNEVIELTDSQPFESLQDQKGK